MKKTMVPRVVKIYSENNDFQYADTLRRKREKRLRQREFFVEGVGPSIRRCVIIGTFVPFCIHAISHSRTGLRCFRIDADMTL